METRFVPCQDCTNYGMAIGRGGWWERYGFLNLFKRWNKCKTCNGEGGYQSEVKSNEQFN